MKGLVERAGGGGGGGGTWFQTGKAYEIDMEDYVGAARVSYGDVSESGLAGSHVRRSSVVVAGGGNERSSNNLAVGNGGEDGEGGDIMMTSLESTKLYVTAQQKNELDMSSSSSSSAVSSSGSGDWLQWRGISSTMSNSGRTAVIVAASLIVAWVFEA